MNDNPKNNMLLSENIRQKKLTMLEYFDAYICHDYQPEVSDLYNCVIVLQLSGRNGLWIVL